VAWFGTKDDSASRRTAQPANGDRRFLDPQIVARISNLELVAKFIVQGFLIGLHRSPYHGFSSEFSAYRKYTKGDSIRFIDWKIAARTDRYYVKQFEDNTNTRCHILLDASGSMAFGGGESKEGRGIQKWLYARNLAAALAFLMHRQGDAVGLTLLRDGAASVASARATTAHLHHLYRLLSEASPVGKTNLGSSLAGLPERFPQRGMVVFIGDLLDEPERIAGALKAFRFRRHEILLFHVLSPEERDFPYTENTEFVDMETGTALVTQASYYAKMYRAAQEAHIGEIRRFCRQSDIDFVTLPTDELLGTALMAYLARRQRAW
jgi:uncharacterized protein (DUF58 family)